MGNVMVIPAKRQVGNTARQQDATPKLRVAAYCRVSTDSDEQATSYDAQVEHYTEFIQKNQNGQVQVNHNHFLGYTKDADGNLIIDPEQAEVVKRIYREYLEGYSMDRIAKGLEADGILTGAGKTKWWTSTINKILRNEKYIGDALLQKTYATDFLNKTRVKNNGIVPQYYVEGNHEAIIPKDIFLRVQEELVRRRVAKTSANGKKRSYSCNHCFAQIVICGECGEMFRRIHWNNRGCKSIVWRCISRLEPTGQECHARTVNETVLENVVVQAINTLLGDKSTYQTQLQQNIAKVIRSAQQNTADGIDEKLQELQKKLLKKVNNKEAYDEVADEIFKLREQREKCTVPLLFPLCYIFPYKFTNSDKGKYKGTESFDVYSQTKLSLIVRVTAWLLAIPDTLFFQPTFPFSDYCLKRRKAQSAKG